MATYGQPKMLEVWFETLRSYSPETLAQMEILIVDDCGTPPAAIPDDLVYELPCQIFRVTEDIPWNQGGARNLALEQCRTPLILFVDPDMVFPAAMMEHLLKAGSTLPEGEVIRFMLKHKDSGVLDGSSPNTWFLHVSDFLKIGGYDEDYAGNKGWSDVQLLDVMRTIFKVHHRKDLFADFYSIKDVSDAAVMSLDRSHVVNRKLRVRKVNWARRRGGWRAFVKIGGRPRIRFKWEQIL
jgi:hypothetical protein